MEYSEHSEYSVYSELDLCLYKWYNQKVQKKSEGSCNQTARRCLKRVSAF